MHTTTHRFTAIAVILAFLLSVQLVFAISGAGAATSLPDTQPEKGVAIHKGWPSHLRFLSGPNGGQWFTMGDPIAEILTRHVVPTNARVGGGVENIASINAKRGDIGFSLTCFMGASQSGEKEYQDIALDNIALLASVYPQVLYFLLRKDFADKNGITDVESLLRLKAPVRFASLKPGTASKFTLDLLFKYGYDTSFDDLRKQGWNIAFNNYAETADNFVSGELDCFAYTAGTVVPLILTMEKHTSIVVLSVERKVLDLMQKKFNLQTYTIKPGVYSSVQTPVDTLSDYTCLLVRKDFPDDLVFEIAKALWENRKVVSDIIVDFGMLSPDSAAPPGLPMHPGALAFWQAVAKKQQ